MEHPGRRDKIQLGEDLGPIKDSLKPGGGHNSRSVYASPAARIFFFIIIIIKRHVYYDDNLFLLIIIIIKGNKNQNSLQQELLSLLSGN